MFDTCVLQRKTNVMIYVRRVFVCFILSKDNGEYTHTHRHTPHLNTHIHTKKKDMKQSTGRAGRNSKQRQTNTIMKENKRETRMHTFLRAAAESDRPSAGAEKCKRRRKKKDKKQYYKRQEQWSMFIFYIYIFFS